MLLLAPAAGCGRPPDATPAGAAPPATADARADAQAGDPESAAGSAPEPGPGSVRLRVDEHGLTLVANATPRRPLLEELAARLHFELVASDLGNEPVSAHVERGRLEDALPQLLADRSYRVDHRYDAVTRRHEVTRLEVAPRGAAVFSAPPPATPAGAPEKPDASGGPGRDAVAGVERADAGPETAPSGDGVDWKALVLRLDDADAEERIDALNEIDPDGDGLALIIDRLTRDPDPRVRAAAAENLEDADTLAGVDALVRALSDPDKQVVLAAIDALEFTEDYTVVENLLPLLNHPDPEIREVTRDAICFIGSCPDEDDD